MQRRKRKMRQKTLKAAAVAVSEAQKALTCPRRPDLLGRLEAAQEKLDGLIYEHLWKK